MKSTVRRHPQSTEKIRVWATSNGYDAVIWAALGRKFKDVLGVAFSVDAALNYLRNLEIVDSPSFADALSYIRRTPPQIRSPVREAVNRAWPAA